MAGPLDSHNVGAEENTRKYNALRASSTSTISADNFVLIGEVGIGKMSPPLADLKCQRRDVISPVSSLPFSAPPLVLFALNVHESVSEVFFFFFFFQIARERRERKSEDLIIHRRKARIRSAYLQ